MEEKKDSVIEAETIEVSDSKKDSKESFEKSKEGFQVELQDLLTKYNFIIYAANTLLEN
jgi:hypothetical protein